MYQHRHRAGGSVDDGKSISTSDLEALRLLDAFFKIGDPKRRREVVMRAETLASPLSLLAPAAPLPLEAAAVRFCKDNAS